MQLSTRVQLSVMMFLQFCVWGAWYGQMSKYLFTQLKATGDQVGSAYAAFSVAMIVSPFFIGMVADRFFAAQKVLGALNLLGAALLFWLTQIKDAEMFYWVMLAYCLSFAPCISLTSSIALRQMQNPEQDFPAIRVLGTVAWIVITNIVGFWGVGDQVTIFQLAMAVAVVLGLYSFFLPDTPPTATGATSFAQIIGADAFKLFRDRSFVVFFIASILICIPLSFYYAMANPSLTDAGMQNVENKMSLGQVSEVVFMLLIPLAFVRLGVKWMLAVGLVAWIVRFVLFGYGDAGSGEWMFYIAILLHGVCFDFFFVTGQIYTDMKAGAKIKSQAQGLITLATYGVGMYIGSRLSGLVTDQYTIEGVKQWASIWMVPAAIAGAVLLVFLLVFQDRGRQAA
ncbi:MAG: MFS transporter [Bernardetiaceae bacterium]|jgi:nucleoside transporter|nr:MFS transporter [Bernardetiaceae bacterium]